MILPEGLLPKLLVGSVLIKPKIIWTRKLNSLGKKRISPVPAMAETALQVVAADTTKQAILIPVDTLKREELLRVRAVKGGSKEVKRWHTERLI